MHAQVLLVDEWFVGYLRCLSTNIFYGVNFVCFILRHSNFGASVLTTKQQSNHHV